MLAASPGVLAAFKLANLLSFYRNTLAGIVGSDAALVAAVEECRSAARGSFDDQVSQRGERLRKSPPPPTDTLAPPPFVAEGVQRVIELLEAQGGLMDADAAGGPEDTTAVLSSVIDPVVAGSSLRAHHVFKL